MAFLSKQYEIIGAQISFRKNIQEQTKAQTLPALKQHFLKTCETESIKTKTGETAWATEDFFV